MGSAFARRLSASGHELLITSRNVDEANEVARNLGGKVTAVAPERVAGDADLLIAATPFPQQAKAIQAAGNIAGKVIIEISNPITDDMSALAVGHTTSAVEEVAKAVPGARFVKAFNTVFAQVLGANPRDGARVQVFCRR